MVLPSQSFTRNCLLSTLSAEDFAVLQPDLERVDVPVRHMMVEPDVPIEHCYFLESGVASMITFAEGGDEIEVGLFGRDGFSGTAAVLRAGQSPIKSIIQIGGCTALRIRAELLVAACRQSDSLQAVLLRFVQALTVQGAQTSAANAHYALPERLARWLLMCHDRVEGDDVALTHEFMSIMLAVRRSGVTVTLHTLEGTGAIRSKRGMLTVTDRAKLEEIAGESYGRAEAEYSRLIAPFGKSATIA